MMYTERKYDPAIDDAPQDIPYLIEKENTVFDENWVPLKERWNNKRKMLNRQKTIRIVFIILLVLMICVESLYPIMDLICKLYIPISYFVFTNKTHFIHK